MRLSNISFPYPVLGVNDDILPGLKDDSVLIKIDTSDTNNYTLSISLDFENEHIKDLIKEGYATYICEVNCTKTNLRKSVNCNDSNFSFIINRKSISGNVELYCYVTVRKPIDNYINPGFNEDYQGAIFNLTEGDILVGFPTRSFVADSKFDKLNSATSFMQIRHDKDSKYTNFEFTSSTIDIKLPTELFNLYNSGVGVSCAEIIHSSLAYSALLSALYEINNYPEHLWAKAIVQLVLNNNELKEYYEIENEQIHFSDITYIATILLKDPCNRMLHKLDSMNPSSSIFDND